MFHKLKCGVRCGLILWYKYGCWDKWIGGEIKIWSWNGIYIEWYMDFGQIIEQHCMFTVCSIIRLFPQKWFLSFPTSCAEYTLSRLYVHYYTLVHSIRYVRLSVSSLPTYMFSIHMDSLSVMMKILLETGLNVFMA